MDALARPNLVLDVNEESASAGDFYIDPWTPVDRAVITHAHSDHACAGSRRYLTAERGEAVLCPPLDRSASFKVEQQ